MNSLVDDKVEVSLFFLIMSIVAFHSMYVYIYRYYQILFLLLIIRLSMVVCYVDGLFMNNNLRYYSNVRVDYPSKATI